MSERAVRRAVSRYRAAD